jgi:hypothetical protein
MNINDYYDPVRKRANATPLTPGPHFILHEADLRDNGK